MYEKIILDYDNYINYMELIFNKYIPTDIDLRFIPGRRFPLYWPGKPLNEHDSLIGTNFIRNEPYYPYKCIEFLLDSFNRNVYLGNKHEEMFRRNFGIPNGGINFCGNKALNDYELLYSYLPNITQDDVSIVIKILDYILNDIFKYTENYSKCIWYLDLDGPYTILENHGEIGSFRFIELLDHQGVNLDLALSKEELWSYEHEFKRLFHD